MPQAMLRLAPAVSCGGAWHFSFHGRANTPLRGARKMYRNCVVHFEWLKIINDATICQFYWGRGQDLDERGQRGGGGGQGITRMVQYAGVAARLKVAPIRLLYHAIPFD